MSALGDGMLDEPSYFWSSEVYVNRCLRERRTRFYVLAILRSSFLRRPTAAMGACSRPGQAVL